MSIKARKNILESKSLQPRILSRSVNKLDGNAKAETIFKELGNYLRDHRVRAGLSQMQVSRELGYSTSQFLSNCERGISSLPLEKLPILVKLYRLRKKDLIDFILRAQKNYLERQFSSNDFGRRKLRKTA